MRIAAIGMLVFCVALAGVSPSLAQEQEKKYKIGDYLPDFHAEDWVLQPGEDVPSLAELRGLTVVVFCFASFHEGGSIVVPFLNMMEANPFLGRAGGVLVIGLTDADRKRTEGMLIQNKVTFPVGTASKTADEWEIQGNFGLVVIDPEGRLALHSNSPDLSQLQTALVDIAVKNPPTRSHPSEAKIVRRLIDETRQLVKQEKYREAYTRIAEAVSRSVLGDPLRSEAMELADLIELMAQNEMARVPALFDAKDYKGAAGVLRTVMRSFKSTDTGKAAKKRIEELEKVDGDFKLAIGGYSDEGVAASLLVQARTDIKARKIGSGYRKLDELVTKYPGTEAGEIAKGMIARMKENANVWGYVMDDQASAEAGKLIAQARSLLKSGRCPDAKKLLERVLDEFPGTTFEAEAKQELIKLPC